MGGCGKSCHSSRLPIYPSRLPMDPDILLPFPHKASQLQYPCALPPSLKAPLQPFKLPFDRHSLGPHSRAVTPQHPCAHFVLRCTRELFRPKQYNIFTKSNTHTEKHGENTNVEKYGFPILVSHIHANMHTRATNPKRNMAMPHHVQISSL